MPFHILVEYTCLLFKAQIKKRTGGPGGGEQTEEHKAREQKESQNEEVAASPAHFSRSPRSAVKLAGAALVLPPLGSKDGGYARNECCQRYPKIK